MRWLSLSLLAITATTSIAAPDYIIEKRYITEIHKRQADIGQLLQLASLAGISVLPTDPALLLSLGPLANSLASQLPTPSVLSVLVTAAPSGFVSSIVNDPSYASSFESAFAAGSSPSWFNALPSDVKSYLHTYSGFGGLAGAAGAVESVASGGSKGTAAASGSKSGSGSVSVTTSVETTTQTTASSGGSAGSQASSAGSSISSEANAGASSAASGAGAVASSSSSAQGEAMAQPTAGIALGFAAAVGVLGVAAGL